MNIPPIFKQFFPQREDKPSVRLIACGNPEDVKSVIEELHALGFPEVQSLTSPVPFPEDEEEG